MFRADLTGPFLHRTPTLGQTGSLSFGSSIFCDFYLLKNPNAVSGLLSSAHTLTNGRVFPCGIMVGSTSLQKEDGHRVTQLPSLVTELLFNQMVDFQGHW